MGKRILVVDDHLDVKDFILDPLEFDYEVCCVTKGMEAVDKIATEPFDIVIIDVSTPDMSGEELTTKIKGLSPDIPILAVTGYGSTKNAIELIDLGVFDYLEKPFTVEKLKHVIGKAFEYSLLKRENKTLRVQLNEREKVKNFVGNSVQVQHVREKIKLVARTDAAILVTGESGTGKQVVAHEIHRLSPRADKPFVTVNCASIPANLLENELFGRETAGSTRGVSSRPGKLELAHGGTILLREIGKLGLNLQARLLAVIEKGEFERAGGTGPIEVDTRVIGTTNVSLRDEIRKGRFREDLYYRLNVVPLDVPPLRERKEDIPLLINHFIGTFSARTGKAPIALTHAAVDRLCNAYWKGNVRQLANVIERAVVLRGGTTLDEDYFQFENERDEQLSRVEHAFRFGSIREMEKLMILNRLKDQDQNRTRSADSLDISVRTLRNKLNEYNVPKKAQDLVQEKLSGV